MIHHSISKTGLERLLDADDRPGILERGPDLDPTAAPKRPTLLPDRPFAGRFKLRQKLGEGGVGEVWIADQVEPRGNRWCQICFRSP